MQCLSSTNEAFLSQKTDLIAELKMSKDINGIRKMKVEKAKMEGSYDKEAYLDVTKQFTAAHFVDQVSLVCKSESVHSFLSMCFSIFVFVNPLLTWM